jgi:nondiscriminating aspartyl-tRNA synthetase
LKYFEHKAYLSQSPQLYKQIAVSAFERVFSVNKVFRAEPSSTTRHLTEIVSLDAEIAFIDSWTDIRDLSEQVVKYVIEQVQSKCSKELEYLKVELPQLPKSIPTISLTEAQELIFKETGKDSRGEKDLNPEDERSLCAIIKTLHESDFVYVYGYPTRMKPFYVYPSENNPIYNEGVDLLCRGVEWLSGGRRINDYNQLRKHAAEWGAG